MTVKFLILMAAFLFVLSCGRPSTSSRNSLVNLAHLNHLFDRALLAGDDSVAIIHIYAEYPDYKPVKAKGEGFTCVDDMARAAVVYLRYGQYFNNAQALEQSRQLIFTLLKMQAANGCFYNFIRSNGHIEKQNRNSQPLPDWWTWRAFWALSEFGLRQSGHDAALDDAIRKAISRVLPHVRNLYRQGEGRKEFAGFMLPTWLPQKYGADQASILLKALVNTFIWTNDSSLLLLMHPLVKGILAVQVVDPASPVNGVFLSWKNFWHAYGNSQADALLDYFRVSGDSLVLHAALREIDLFYPYLKKENYLHAFILSKQNGRVRIEQKIPFEQIAYDFRPMIWACLNAYGITQRKKYAQMAGKITSWLAGNNAARRVIYDVRTGRCFDGILSPQKINLNSGAESTVEALLSLLEVERNSISNKEFTALFKRNMR